MNRPKLSRQQALAKVNISFPERTFLLGIRGYYKDSMGKPGVNDRSIYDDCVCLITPDKFITFNANTDPSIFRKGIAVLKPGLHYYKKGMHKISGPHPYPALRPATPDESLPVVRDGQGESRGIAINIHKGGYNTTSSEGCQTIYPDQWNEFIKEVYAAMESAGQKKIPYLLIEE